MGCTSDYLRQNKREGELQRAARLYAYVLEQAGSAVPKEVIRASNDYYCKDDFVPSLCAALTAADPDLIERVFYNAKDKTARDLADWWEEHQEADRIREAAEAQKAKKPKATDAEILEKLLRGHYLTDAEKNRIKELQKELS